MTAEPSRILLVKLSSLGDVVHALPVAAAARAAWPRAHLAWVVERREAAVLRGHPALDEIIVADTRAWRRARRPAAVRRALADVLALARRLRAGRFDVAIDLQALVKSGLVTAASRAPVRIGFGPRWAGESLSALFTNRRVMPGRAARHVVEQYLALLAPLGVAPARAEFIVPACAEAEDRIDDWLGRSGLKPRRRLVVLNPGAGRADKRWPVESFRQLAARLGAEVDAHAVVVWGPGEEPLAREIADTGGAAPHPLLAPPTDLDDLVALLRRASVVVAADTGPLHLAAAVGTACVGLYGPTSAARNGPYGGRHRALQSPDGTMAGIPVDAVLHAVGQALSA